MDPWKQEARRWHMTKFLSKLHIRPLKDQRVSLSKIKLLPTIGITLNSYNCLSIISEVDDRLIEMYIKETCESAVLVSFHPNTMVCINLQEMEDSGGVKLHIVLYVNSKSFE